MPLAGRPLVEWSIEAFRACESVRSIVVAAPPGQADGFAAGGTAGSSDSLAPRDAERDRTDPPLHVVEGGATRSRSVTNALAVVDTDLVAIHDAARPLVTPELIEALMARLDADPGAAGVIAATPLADTIKLAGKPGTATKSAFDTDAVSNAPLVVERTEDRDELWAAQTPQVFRTEALRGALAVDEETRDAATDEAMLVEAAGGRVLIHPAPPENLKVTTPLDLAVAELLLAERAAP